MFASLYIKKPFPRRAGTVPERVAELFAEFFQRDMFRADEVLNSAGYVNFSLRNGNLVAEEVNSFRNITVNGDIHFFRGVRCAEAIPDSPDFFAVGTRPVRKAQIADFLNHRDCGAAGEHAGQGLVGIVRRFRLVLAVNHAEVRFKEVFLRKVVMEEIPEHAFHSACKCVDVSACKHHCLNVTGDSENVCRSGGDDIALQITVETVNRGKNSLIFIVTTHNHRNEFVSGGEIVSRQEAPDFIVILRRPVKIFLKAGSCALIGFLVRNNTFFSSTRIPMQYGSLSGVCR